MNRGIRHGSRELRIIGGAWRGRKLRFPQGVAIRPTPDRVRETLFNWLQPVIHGARCLDLFAGSGALGLEALSRGASRAVFVDTSREGIEAIRALARLFGAQGAELVVDDGLHYLKSAQGPFDVVFLDPPFDAGLLPSALSRLAAAGCLATGALCYVEMPRRDGLPALPEGLSLYRQGAAGEVGYYLIKNSPQAPL
jgi:16S rRNA (guanine966-N2)-methyltransferase